VRVAHRDDDCRMPKQFLHGYNIGAFPEQPRCESVTQRVPRHARQSCLFTGQFETGFQVSKAIAGHLVVENVGALSHREPCGKNPVSRIIQRDHDLAPSLLNEYVQPERFKIYLLPLQVENIARTKSRIEGEHNHVLNVRRAAGKQSMFRFFAQGLKLKIVFAEKLDQAYGILPLTKIPAFR